MRIKLSEKYQNEREDICNRLISILKLDDNNSFLLCDLDNDEEKQNKIIEMKAEKLAQKAVLDPEEERIKKEQQRKEKREQYNAQRREKRLQEKQSLQNSV